MHVQKVMDHFHETFENIFKKYKNLIFVELDNSKVYMLQQVYYLNQNTLDVEMMIAYYSDDDTVLILNETLS